MQQTNGQMPAPATPSPVPTTGTGAEATTAPISACRTDAEATITMHVTHDQVTLCADLAMGRGVVVLQRWKRRSGPGKGWWRVEGPVTFRPLANSLGRELSDLLDRLPFPYEVANMLPRASTPAALAAIAQAQQEVAHV